MKVAVALSTKDRVELSQQAIVPLQKGPFDLWVVDGSKTDSGIKFAENSGAKHVRLNIRGGADPALAYMLTELLAAPEQYTHIALVENDVVLDADWFEPTMELFEKGRKDGLEVGAASARCYEDRILIQRDGYAVMHNLGAGQTVLTRRAAELILRFARTGWTLENRRVFAQLSGQDIGSYWAFAGNAHMLCWDWGWDRVIAQHGLCSLALTPAKCEMIGQVPPLEEQGLTLVRTVIERFRDDVVFDRFRQQTAAIRDGDLAVPCDLFLYNDDGTSTIFSHQFPYVGGWYNGEWQLRWTQGMGPFAWQAAEPSSAYNGQWIASAVCLISGACAFLVSGGKTGGKIRVIDEKSGYNVKIDVNPEGDSGRVLQVQVPSGIGYRNVRLEALTPGVTFFGIVCREKQPLMLRRSFEHSWLPLP